MNITDDINDLGAILAARDCAERDDDWDDWHELDEWDRYYRDEWEKEQGFK